MELFFDVSSKHKVMNANAPNYPTPLMHPNRILDEHDLIYIRTGEWEIGQGDETFLAREGDVLILSAGQSHYGVSPCRAGTGTMYIHALAHPTDAAAPYLPEISREGVLLQSHIHTHGDVQIKNCFEQIVYAVSRDDHALASAYFDVLLCELRRHLQSNEKKHLAEQIRERITPVGSILKNSEIARALNVSVKTAEVAFKNTYGKTIHQCILETRVEQAKFYIVNHPDMTLSTLATTLGFYDEFHLSRHFKAICGISPSAFRKQVHGNHDVEKQFHLKK